jgi:hypothetical protein
MPMRVVFRNPDMSECPKNIEPYTRNPHLTPDREYEVQSIVAFQGVVAFLLISDADVPMWEPAWLFRVTDYSIPQDWICNSMLDWPELIIGPSFIADSQDSYSRMVELERAQVDELRKRIERRNV